MKVKLVTLDDFRQHPHPASKLFRLIELKTIYENTRNIDFRQPSIDIGCGDGYLSSILFDSRFTYGVDNGEAGDVDIAIKRHLYKKVFIESAEKMSLKNNSVNFAFSNSVIEHIPDIELVLSEISRILKKGGDFVFTSPSDKFPEFLFVSNKLNQLGFGFLGNWYKKKRNKLLNHYHLYSHQQWTRMLSNHNLVVKKYAYYIEKKTAFFWDKLAIKVRLRKLFDKNAPQHLFKKYRDTIIHYYNHDQVLGDSGASLFIHAVKK